MRGQTGFLAAELAALGFDPVKAEALTEYGERLLEKNKVMNLTAITDPFDVATLHFLDCAHLAAALPPGGADGGPCALADVGTGAGFPGLVAAILRPDAAVTLLDPLEKRLDFIREVIDALGLENVTLLHVRGEEAGRDPALRQAFDAVTARAVADLAVLGELCVPLVRLGGLFLPMKTAQSDEEAAQAMAFLGELGADLVDWTDHRLAGTQVCRRIWRFQKRRPTPEAFPRRWSKIKRK